MPSSAYPLRSADITPSQDVYFNKAYMSFLDSAVDYPDVWTYDTAKDWQYGENIRVAIGDIGVGNTSNDSFFDLYFEASPHNVCDLASDENGEVLTDENNEPLIFWVLCYIVNFIFLVKTKAKINRIIHKVFKVNYWKFVNKISFNYYNNFNNTIEKVASYIDSN